MEALQKTGAFKIRGVLNHLLLKQEQSALPEKIVAYSTGNHAIAVAWVAKMLGIKARIYLPSYSSAVKQQIARDYGGEIIITETRLEAENKCFNDSRNNFHFVPPSDDDAIIAGAGTVCLEALEVMNHPPDAIFASCGGGGLLSGCYLAREYLGLKSKLCGVEPSRAADASISLQRGSIYKFQNSPETVADGLKALNVSERTFEYLNKLDEFTLVEEDDICYWSAWLLQLLKVPCEPSCAISMGGAYKWLGRKDGPQKVLVIISGGNIDSEFFDYLTSKDYLSYLPSSYKMDDTTKY
jgi:threonine dehydratase